MALPAVGPHDTAALSTSRPALRRAPPRPAAAPGANATTAYSATIPAAAFKAGDMVRWAVVVTAANGLSARDPDPSINAGGYKGTVIAPEQANGTLPVLYWCALDASASAARVVTKPQRSVTHQARGEW